MPATDLLRSFERYADRPPSRGRQVLTSLLGIALTVAVWDRRGPVAGVVALLVYGVMFTVLSLRFEESRAWSARHPWLDRLVGPPVFFLGLAYLTPLSLTACAAIAVAAWAALMAFKFRVARIAAARHDGRLSG